MYIYRYISLCVCLYVCKDVCAMRAMVAPYCFCQEPAFLVERGSQWRVACSLREREPPRELQTGSSQAVAYAQNGIVKSNNIKSKQSKTTTDNIKLYSQISNRIKSNIKKYNRT